MSSGNSGAEEIVSDPEGAAFESEIAESESDGGVSDKECVAADNDVAVCESDGVLLFESQSIWMSIGITIVKVSRITIGRVTGICFASIYP